MTASYIGGPTTAAAPAQSGNITAEAVTVANRMNAGIVDDEGKQVYLSYQLGAVSYNDAATALQQRYRSLGVEHQHHGFRIYYTLH